MLGGRTLREAYETLAVLDAAPSVPGAPEPEAVSGQLVFDVYQDLADVFPRLSDRWHVSPLDFVWRDCTAVHFGTDDRGQVLRPSHADG